MAPTTEQYEAIFERTAETYEDTFEPLMKFYATEAIKSVPSITSSSVVHDNASGPGIVTAAILSSFTSSPELPKIYATDLSGAMIKKLNAKPWADKIDAQVMNAMELTFPDAMFTHSFTNFGLMFLSLGDAGKAAGQLYRTLQPGGTAEISTWHKLGYMDIFKEVVQQVKPGAVVDDNVPIASHWMKEETLRDVLIAGGFKAEQIAIKSVSHDVPGHMWACDGMLSIKQLLIQRVTENWGDGERESFVKAFEERIVQEQKVPRYYQVIAWIAISKK